MPVPSARRPDRFIDQPAAQRRTVHTLIGSQMLGGTGVASGIAVGSILAEEILGSPDLAGLANTAQVLGAAVLTVPMARLMAARGRRTGLATGYVTGAIGAVLAVLAGVWGSFALLLCATALFGAANAANNQARYAATDLAEPVRRGRALSIVVWAITLGAVLGPNLVGVMGRVGEAVGLPALTGPFLLSVVAFAAAGAWLTWRLRPDPLLLARRLTAAAPPRRSGSFLHGLKVLTRSPMGLLGLAAVAIGHTVMVSVMVMTPLHMDHGGAGLDVVGFVISVHILGMYALSPVTGWLVDRIGGQAVIGVGAVVLLLATLTAAQTPAGWSPLLMIGLFLLGLGWSCTLVSGSTVLTAAVPGDARPSVQGTADLVMGLAAASGSALAGLVVGVWGYGWLCLGAAVLAVLLGLAGLAVRAARPRVRTA